MCYYRSNYWYETDQASFDLIEEKTNGKLDNYDTRRICKMPISKIHVEKTYTTNLFASDLL
jgi:hypothetical protein